MKATGIVRRIDDLGRVVIPKEIRKTLRIKEGTPLEIFTDREGEIILKKYSPIGELNVFAKEYAEALAQSSGMVACITDGSMVGVFAGTKQGFPPCTPQACMEILDHYGIDCTGKKAVVVGRSLVVGKPAAMMLLKKNATVTICHTRTKDMPSVVKEADIVIVAAGRAGVVDDTYLCAGQTVIDVGINVNEEGKLCGDVAYAKAEPIVEAITPVPGGVGSVTTSVLVGHVVEAAMRKNS